MARALRRLQLAGAEGLPRNQQQQHAPAAKPAAAAGGAPAADAQAVSRDVPSMSMQQQASSLTTRAGNVGVLPQAAQVAPEATQRASGGGGGAAAAAAAPALDAVPAGCKDADGWEQQQQQMMGRHSVQLQQQGSFSAAFTAASGHGL